MILHHYTSVLHLPYILRDGAITRGEVLTSPATRFAGVWLTKEPNGSRQFWAKTYKAVCKGIDVPIDKAEFRLTINIPDDQNPLFRWDKLAVKAGAKPEYIRFLSQEGTGKPVCKDWYVFVGQIPVSWIIRIDRKVGKQYEPCRDAQALPMLETRFSTAADTVDTDFVDARHLEELLKRSELCPAKY